MLTHNELISLPWSLVVITDSKIIANHQILEINGNFYSVHSNNIFPNHYNQQTRWYNKGGQVILFELQSGAFARLLPADIIKSVVDEFDGFEYGKVFELRNGQRWRQTDGLNSPCSPGGTIWIFNHSIIRVANWNFDVSVQLLN